MVKCFRDSTTTTLTAPKGYDITLLVIGYKADRYYTGEHSFTTDETNSQHIDLKEISKQDLLLKVNELGKLN